MLCDRVLRNVASLSPDLLAGKASDTLDVSWRDCARRAIRGTTRGGVAVGVLLPLGQSLRHGDVLFEDDARLVVASVVPVEVWVASFEDTASMAAAALELGNLHVPVEVAEGATLVALPDGPTRGVLDRRALKWEAQLRRFAPLRETVLGGELRLSPTFGVPRAGGRPAAGTPAAVSSRTSANTAGPASPGAGPPAAPSGRPGRPGFPSHAAPSPTPSG